MIRRIITGLVVIAASLGLAGTTAGASTAGAPRHLAVTQTPDNYGGCPTRNTCFWTNDNGTGAMIHIANAGYLHNVWVTFCSVFFCSPNPGSMEVLGGSSVFLFDRQANTWTCVGPNTAAEIGHSYGEFYISYGNSGCHGGLPPGY